MPTPAEPQEGGFALLIVLWTMVLVALIATQITASGRAEVQLATNLRGAAELEAAADGAVHEALFHLLDPSPAGWRADGARRVVASAQGPVGLRVLDEAGKVNPNAASPELLAALLRQLGADARRAEGIAAAIADWRFPGAQARPGGGKAREYRNAGRDYGPPEAPFQSIGELGGVLGMNADLLVTLAPYLSLYTEGDPQPGLAAAPVLAALRATLGNVQMAVPATGGVQVVAITASVARPDGSRFIRRAVARVGAGPDGRPYQILAWASGEG